MKKSHKRATICLSLRREEIALLTSISRQTGRSRSAIVSDLIQGLGERNDLARGRG